MQELFEKKYGPGKFELTVVKDMVPDGAFDSAVRGVAGIIHSASIVNMSSDAKIVIPGVVAGATGILKSAMKEQSRSIKSFVYTSSSAAALVPVPDEEVVITNDTWNEEAVREA